MSKPSADRAEMARAFNEPITPETAREFKPTGRTDNVKVALTTRFPRELVERLAVEAQRRGTTPSEVVRDLVDRGLRTLEESPVVTIRVADIHAALDGALRRAA